jgi:predicted neuraminidase
MNVSSFQSDARRRYLIRASAMAALLLLGRQALCVQGAPGLLTSEFIFTKAPFPSAHASTLVEAKDGHLIAAWFGGTDEKEPDVGVWLSHHENGQWSTPVEVANGVQSPSLRYPCWNPVLFQPKTGPLLLFYKVGPDPREWWGMLKTSDDNGRTWSEETRLPDGILGPIKNKPIQLASGDILSPSSSEHKGWRIHFERTSDLGKTWQATPPLNDGYKLRAIQPTILTHNDGRLQALCRTESQRIYETWSKDQGKTWSDLASTELPNPDSGIDAVTLADGRHLLVYNHTTEGRSPINVAVSDDGKSWSAALILEEEPGAEFSYPAVIQTNDGKVHLTYTWKRQRIKHAAIDPAKLRPQPIVGGAWPEAISAVK